MRNAAIVVLALLLLSCASNDPAPEPTTTVAAPVASATATTTPTPAATRIPPISPERPPDGSLPGIFLLDWQSTTSPKSEFRPLDDATAEDLPGFAAHDFLQAAVEVSMSPDNRTLAATIALSGSAPGSKVVTIDLATWTMHEHMRSPWYPGGYSWSSDGRSFYFQRPGNGNEYQRPEIVRLDVASGGLTVLGQADFLIGRGLHLAPDERSVYMLGMHSSDARADILQGDPFLARLDFASGTFTSVELPGMLMGQVRPGRPEDDWGSYRPALAVSPDGRSAFVVDSASDRLVAFDLPAMTIREDRSLAAPRPAWKRGLSWLGSQVVSTAHAKGSEYHTAHAAVTPDGRFLVASATRDEWCGEPIRPCTSNRPAGLRVIDLRSMNVVLRDETIGDFALSRDGRWVVGYSHWYEEPAEGKPVEYRGAGFQVFDLAKPGKSASLGSGSPVAAVVFDPSNRYAVALGPGPGLTADFRDGCPKPCYSLQVVDLQDPAEAAGPHIVAERFLFTRAALLLPE